MAATGIQQLRRRLRLFSWSGAFLLAGILIVLNFILSYVPLRLDTSDGNAYSISKGTKDLLGKLEDTLLVRIVFSPELPPPYKLNEKYVADLFAEYKRASNGHIRIEYFDPSKSPKAREDALREGLVPGQLDIRKRDRREVAECFMGVSMWYGDRKEVIPLIQDTQGLEYEITVRLKKLINPERIKVGFLTNGGSLPMTSDSIKKVIDPLQQLYMVQSIDATQPIPTDMKAVWMISPTQAVEPSAIDNLTTYLKNGGSVGMLLDRNEIKISEFRTTPNVDSMGPLLKLAGLNLREGLIVDPVCDRIQVRAVQGPYQVINVIDYPYIPWITGLDRAHPVTKDLDGFSMPFASSIETMEQKPGFTYTTLAKSSEFSYLDSAPFDVNPMSDRIRPDRAVQGPFAIAMAVEGSFGEGEQAQKGRMILFSSSRFIRSEYPARVGNQNVFLNVLDWSAQDEALLQIRSKGFVRRPLKMMSDTARALFKYAMIFTLPLLVLAAGFIVWRRQKTRRALLPLVYKEA